MTRAPFEQAAGSINWSNCHLSTDFKQRRRLERPEEMTENRRKYALSVILSGRS
jgi:hypothetical protein